LEIPNLRIKSGNMIQKVFAYWCLGVETPDDPFMPESRRWMFVVYAIASYLYRWFISFAILLFLYTFLKPYKLGAISALLAIGALFSLLVVPAYRLGKFVFSPGRTVAVSKLRIASSSMVLLGLAAAVLAIPLPLRVHAVVTLEPRDADPVYVRQLGRLESVHVAPGDRVDEGQLLAVLSNDEMHVQLEQLLRDRATAEVDMGIYRELQQWGQMEVARASFTQLDALVQERNRQIEELKVRAPSAGTIIPTPLVPEPPYSEHLVALPTWHRTPLDPTMLGSHLEPPTPFCSVGDLGEMEAQLVIDQADVEYVRQKRDDYPGDTVWIKLDAFPLETLEAAIDRIEPVELQVAQRNLSNQAGGELATKTGPGGVERPLHSSYVARVPLDMGRLSNRDTDRLLRPGMRGKAKIDCRKRTVGQWIWRWVTQTFRFRL
jgi:putative peptide zinc metalloprotease protein